MLPVIRWCTIACALLAAPVSAQGQNPQAFPDRPIRLVVAFPPGGATDTLTRQITQELGEALGASIVIENKPGAGGYIAWNHVAASEADGYTLLMAENAIGISQALYKKHASNFDPLKQYNAIAAVATSPLVLAAANNVQSQLGRRADRLFAHGAAENELCLRRHRQRLASGVRGGQGRDRNGRRFTSPTRAAAPP